MPKKKRRKPLRKRVRRRIIAMLESRIWDLALQRLAQTRSGVVLITPVVWTIVEMTRR
jgi:hypothetical protein